MVQFELRKTKTDIGTLSVRIANRRLSVDTNISLHLKMKVKDWVPTSQLPKNIYDSRPISELGGLSYAQLTDKLQKIKKTLTALENANTLTVDSARVVVNDVLNEELREELSRPFEEQPISIKPTFPEYIGQYIHECETGERLKRKSTNKIKPSTLKNYRGLLSQIIEYQKSRHRLVDWDDLNFDFYNDYKQFFIEKNYSPNTIAKHIRSIKTILGAAKDMHYTTRDDFMSSKWSADREDVDNIYLTSERIKQLTTFDMSGYKEMKVRADKFAEDDEEKKGLIHALKRNTYRQRLNEARDIFVMGCLTGQRVSDYKRINKDMIETIVGDDKFLHIRQEKTGKDVYIPYSEEMETILNRYNGRLPKMNDQDFNKRIKVIGLLIGWTEPAGLEERRGLLRYTSNKRFCDAIKTHTARRSFATNAYKVGVPLSAIMAVTGHTSEEMLKRYLKLGSKERAILAAAEFKKIKTAL